MQDFWDRPEVKRIITNEKTRSIASATPEELQRRVLLAQLEAAEAQKAAALNSINRAVASTGSNAVKEVAGDLLKDTAKDGAKFLLGQLGLPVG